ncbi:hypothetical protein V5O48_001532 [Marasmius crinis-equi]|uniref:DUF6697 domain-containing protein n=1 Tax=Marasmius crinis-equi TaxID=585013 RepID=A0ABR3FY44_9AGAR
MKKRAGNASNIKEKDAKDIVKHDEDAQITQRGSNLQSGIAESVKNEEGIPQVKKEEGEDEKIRTKEQAKRFLRQMRNDAMKVKKEAEEGVLDPLTVVNILEGVKPFPIPLDDDDDLDIHFTVSRPFLSSLFGGSSQSTFPDIATEKIEEKLTAFGFAEDQWQCIKPDWNPHMPSVPGRPGLYFGSRSLKDDLTPNTEWDRGICRVFACIDTSKWLYVGQYEIEYVSTLTIDEWKGLPDKAKETWIKGIVKKTWARKHRIRIYLRNRPGTDRQFTLAEYSLKLADTANKYLGVVTEAQVADALDCGEEAIVVWKMRCVDYEKEFQRHIISNSPSSTGKKVKGKKREAPEADSSTSAKRMRTRSSAKQENA